MVNNRVEEVSAKYRVDGYFSENENAGESSGNNLVPVGYKQTEVGVIPEDWECRQLGEIALVFSGGTPNRKVAEYWGGDIPWITTALIDGGEISQALEFITKSGVECSSTKWCKPDTILMAMYGQGKTRGKVAVLKIAATINQACAAIELKSTVSVRYVLSVLNHRYEEIRDLSNAGGQENLSGTIIKSILIAYPPVVEQTAIANALSDVDALIANLESLIAKKQAIKTATMQQLLTGRTRLPQFALREDGSPKGHKQSELGEVPEDWEIRRLLDVATLIHGKAHEPFVNELGKYVVVNSKFVSTEGEVRKHCTQNGCAAKKGDVLMVLSDLPNGKALAKCYYTECNDIYAVNQRVCIFRTTLFDSRFLYFILNRHKYFLGLDDGVTQTHILNGDIAAFHVCAPAEIDEQTAIATILSDMDQEIQTLEQRLNKTRQIKQGMMQQLLTGKIRLVIPEAVAQ